MIARSADIAAIGAPGLIGQAATALSASAPEVTAAAMSAGRSAATAAADLRALAGSSSAPPLTSATTAGAGTRGIGNVPSETVAPGGASVQSAGEAVAATPYRVSQPAAATRVTVPAHRTQHHVRHAGSPALSPWPAISPPSVIEHFVGVVPGFIWLFLGLALGAAGTAGSIAFRASRRARRQASELAAVAAAAHTDALTGALNRRGFTEAVERELARARRYETGFVLAYLDVRGLKALNDSQGHQAGDQLLTEVAALLGESAREADVVGRIGGDEFALLLPEQHADAAEAVTGRIRDAVVARRSAMDLGVPWDLTVGTASFPADGETFDALVATADRRLYEQRGIELGGGRRAA